MFFNAELNFNVCLLLIIAKNCLADVAVVQSRWEGSINDMVINADCQDLYILN